MNISELLLLLTRSLTHINQLRQLLNSSILLLLVHFFGPLFINCHLEYGLGFYIHLLRVVGIFRPREVCVSIFGGFLGNVADLHIGVVVDAANGDLLRVDDGVDVVLANDVDDGSTQVLELEVHVVLLVLAHLHNVLTLDHQVGVPVQVDVGRLLLVQMVLHSVLVQHVRCVDVDGGRVYGHLIARGAIVHKLALLSLLIGI